MLYFYVVTLAKQYFLLFGDEPTAYIENTDIVVRSNETELWFLLGQHNGLLLD